MKRDNNRAQAILVYAVLIILVAAAFMAMRSYLLGSMQEKYRQSADVFGEGEQYQEGSTKVMEYQANEAKDVLRGEEK